MGMAASQGRFLALTARKSNVEFEGQQVNQQRMALSNQTANYNKQMLNMKVPVPPDVQQFTNTFYTWQNSAGQTSKITSIQTIANAQAGQPNYTINYGTEVTKVGVAVKATGSEATAQITRKLEKAAVPAKAAVGNPGDANYQPAVPAKEAVYSYYKDGKQLSSITDTNTLARLRATSDSTDPNEEFFGYEDANGKNVYLSAAELAGGGFGQTPNVGDTSTAFIQKYSIGDYSTTENNNTGVPVTIEANSSGRLTTMTMGGVPYNLTMNSEKDETAYEAAMNQYEYDKAEYAKAQADINAHLEIIQAQDKNLELKLKQLDTEQEAIQTEMDAVQKVIQKNTETTFKTFA